MTPGRPRAGSSLPPALRRAFADAVGAALGLTFEGVRESALDRGVINAAAAAGERDAWRFLERVRQREPGAIAALTEALTIGESYFFRDPQHFEVLRAALRDTPADEELRLWSAGCAAGEEPYTMAIVALEELGGAAVGRVEVVATDVHRGALARAETGVYREWSFRGVAPEVRERWFEPVAGGWRVADEVRALVRFESLNLAAADTDWPERVAVAFCRNVLVYFGRDAVGAVGVRMRAALAEGGWLVTAATDPLLSCDGLALDPRHGFIAYRRGEPVTVPVARLAPASAPIPSVEPDVTLAPTPVRAPPLPVPGDGDPGPDAPALLGHARQLADAGDSRAAIDALDAAVAADPFVASAYVLRATLRQAMGSHDAAVRDAKRALLLDRAQVYAHVIAAFSYAALGDAVAARRAVTRARRHLSAVDADAPVPGAADVNAGELTAACEQLALSLGGEAPQ